MPRGRPTKNATPAAIGAATVGYEAQLWQRTDALRGSMDAAEYKHVTLGLLFLKYISDAFEERHALLEAEKAQGADPEDPGRVPGPQRLLGAAGGALATLRDALLPKLLSGELRVKDAERFVAEVA